METTRPNGHWLPTLLLFLLAGGMALVFGYFGRERELKTHVPEFIALSLLAGLLYLISVYLVERFPLGPPALLVILGGGVLFRLLALPASPSLSEDVYRYQWEGRAQRAGFNPYTVYPALPGLAWLEDSKNPIRAARTTPTAYPAFSERVFSWVKTVRGYKLLFTALDLGSLAILLLLLSTLKQPAHRALIYAWNPTVVVAFALCGHMDSLAIVTLLGANLFIISRRSGLAMASLALSVLSKYFPALLFPLFLKRARGAYAAVFAGLVILAYLPYLGAGRELFHGLADYTHGWEANDSLFRLIRLAGNTRGEAELVAGVLALGLVIHAMKNRLTPLRASLTLTAGLVLLSPTAFPWYFTWSIPFLCFYPTLPWLLMSVTAVLGYAPVIAYAAGQPYRDSPFILLLEYAPVLAWLGYEAWRTAGRQAERRPGPSGIQPASNI